MIDMQDRETMLVGLATAKGEDWVGMSGRAFKEALDAARAEGMEWAASYVEKMDFGLWAFCPDDLPVKIAAAIRQAAKKDAANG